MKKQLMILLLLVLTLSCNQNKKETNKNKEIAKETIELNQEEKDFVDLLYNEFKSVKTDLKLDCNQRCMACRQQARYRLSACLRSASNETQRAQCRSNYMQRLRECNNNYIAEESITINESEKVLVDAIFESNNKELANCNQRCMACRQQARYRLSACLRSASNETQRAQCRSNYMQRLRECNN